MNKICLISGGTRGIGLSIVKKLIKNNYKIYSFSKTGLSDFENTQFINIKNDITNFEETQSNIKNILSNENKIDVVIHNSGITKDKFFHKMEYNDWKDVIITNLLSSYNLLNLPINSMRKHKNGDVILISSVNALSGMTGQTNYAASKSGLYGFCKSLAIENASFNIKVNTISPGYIYTDMTQNIDSKIIENIKKTIPLGDFGKPEYIADTVEFLLNSKYITGTNINVNGGLY
jgi:NAD(P)-dependent dehydrogenase (short-subunit alcohol dehydrogenase family)